MKRIKLLVCGASGRMGRRVCALATADERFQCGNCDRSSKATDEELAELVRSADVLVDFSSPAGCLRFAQAAVKGDKPFVSGTTGLTHEQNVRLRELGKKTAVFHSANFSPAVHVMSRLVAEAAERLRGFECSISETHHSAKKDKPSGTALRLAAAVSDAGRPAPEIVSQRIGDVVGDHAVTFGGPCERLELTHRAHSRDLFARGALDAAAWLVGRKPGLYGMSDLWG